MTVTRSPFFADATKFRAATSPNRLTRAQIGSALEPSGFWGWLMATEKAAIAFPVLWLTRSSGSAPRPPTMETKLSLTG